jgi:hypothetical protein
MSGCSHGAVVRLPGLQQERCRRPRALRGGQDGHGLIKYAADRPSADPETAARKLVEIANPVDAAEDGRIFIEPQRAVPVRAQGFSP